MKNQSKIVFICAENEKNECVFHSRGEVCKWLKEFKGVKSCTYKRARLAALRNKIAKLEVTK